MAHIIDVKARFFRFRPPEPMVSSMGQRDYRVLCLIEITADNGLTGYGESWLNFPAWGPRERAGTIEEGVKPVLIGENPEHVLALNDKLWRHLTRIGLQWGSPGAISQAISGADLALWDLAGKLVGLPVCRMVGERGAPVPVYASGLGPIVDEEVVRWHQDRGVQAFKLKIGFNPDQDLRELRRLRKMVGAEALVMADANQAWQAREAMTMADRLQEFNLRWLEEPVAASDLPGSIRVAQHSPVPIAAGENLYGLRTFVDWMDAGGLHVVQPDLTKVGGFSRAYTVARMAEAWGIPYAPHFLGSGLGLLATAHLFAAVPGGLIVELDSNPNRLRTSLFHGGLTIEQGHLVLPAGVGWGLDFDWDVLRDHEFTP